MTVVDKRHTDRDASANLCLCCALPKLEPWLMQLVEAVQCHSCSSSPFSLPFHSTCLFSVHTIHPFRSLECRLQQIGGCIVHFGCFIDCNIWLAACPNLPVLWSCVSMSTMGWAIPLLRLHLTCTGCTASAPFACVSKVLCNVLSIDRFS